MNDDNNPFIPNDPPAPYGNNDCPHARVIRTTDFLGNPDSYRVCLDCARRQHDNYNDQR